MDGITPNTSARSIRSRSSSIVSTGTKFSIGTLAHGQLQPASSTQHSQAHQTASNGIDVRLGQRSFRITARPGSILSIASFDHPPPLYTSSAEVLSASRETLSSVSTITQDHTILPAASDPDPDQDQDQDISSTTALDSVSSRRPTPSPSPPGSLTDVDETSSNALSAHYTRVVRTIDQNHRLEITRLEAQHEAEISALRTEFSRLENYYAEQLAAKEAAYAKQLSSIRHDIDAAYRKAYRAERTAAEKARQDAATEIANAEKAIDARIMVARAECESASWYSLREKSLEITRTEMKLATAHEELRAMTERVEAAEQEAAKREEGWKVREMEKVEKARNEIEDLWEGRWRSRMEVSKEEVARAFESGREAGRKERT
jgi:hypothetical protein